jgi:biotin transport system substrate-specific component
VNQSLSEIRTPVAAPFAQVIRPAGIVLAGSVLAAICAHVAVPLWFTPVPLSLQPFAVLLLGLLLEPQMAAGVFVAYLAEGAAGLPVFAPSPASGGLAHLLGPTGGYLMAYPVAAALISWLWRRTSRSFAMTVASAAAGDLLILGCGALWFSLLPVFGKHFAAMTILPFLPGDALKIALAAAIGFAWMRLRRKSA